MFQKDMKYSLLLDFYGDILSERKREIIELYYNEDLSLAEVADIIKAGQRFLEIDTPKTVICGGLCNYKEILLPFLKEKLGDDFNVEFNDSKMVCGAVNIAKRNAERKINNA